VRGTFVFIAVVVFAFVASRLLERSLARPWLVPGMAYVALGVVLGPVFPLNVISLDLLGQIDLFVSTVLGILGFATGLGLRRVSAGIEPTLAGFTATLGVIVTVALAIIGAVQWLDPALLASTPIFSTPVLATDSSLVSLWLSPDSLWMGLTVGAAAGASSVVWVEAALRRSGIRGARAELLQTMASVSEFTALVCFGMAMAGSRATTSAGALGLTIIEWSVITVAAGGVTGVLFSVFLGSEDEPVRITVASVGVIVFATGVGTALGVSPLFVNVIAGATVALTSPHASRLSDALAPLRFPATVLVFVLAGATWALPHRGYWFLPVGYALVRALARRSFSSIAVATFVSKPELGHRVAEGLGAHGPLPSAISVAFTQLFPELAAPVTTAILGGMIVGDLAALRSMARYLAYVEEIQHTEEAMAAGSTIPREPGR